MAHTLALVQTWLHDLAAALERWRGRLPELLIAAFTLLDAHGVALASDREAGARAAERNHLVAVLHATPEAQLRRQYLQCAHASNQRLLAPDEAILCVLVADVLMQRAFGGDFSALISWYQHHRDAALALQPR